MSIQFQVSSPTKRLMPFDVTSRKERESNRLLSRKLYNRKPQIFIFSDFYIRRTLKSIVCLNDQHFYDERKDKMKVSEKIHS